MPFMLTIHTVCLFSFTTSVEMSHTSPKDRAEGDGQHPAALISCHCSNADFHRHAVIHLKQEYLLQREEINRGLENNMQNKMSCTLLYCMNWNE